ncbi:acyl-CoA synthetase [Ferruginivarius sediminum]|uniref:3-methylmercaptopropionyl-CoA ligase n=1 Tax=Ferruginivarius sediminum TaxID=2661937 RepID=A0A369T9Q7_9PROT|nr:acyl-CoA synthetase [Ferruginivarius sediminum]RDD62018.1 acyl-CoA synthetase [Ferruginivarius sediminum]
MTTEGAHSIFENGLDKNTANYVPLSPLSFLKRSATVYPDKIAVIHGAKNYTYQEFYTRCRRLASALARRGIRRGDTVSVLAPNVPALLEAHYAVPMLGAVLNALNARLDGASVGFILEHGESKVLIADTELSDTTRTALERTGAHPLVVDNVDPLADGGERIGELTYEELLEEGDPDFDWRLPDDEWQAICLNYTSGTTGNPKGVVYHHRGAYLNALGNLITFGLDGGTIYLWTLPMFHCNGWTFTWAVTAAAGTHVCLRKVDPALIFPMIRDHQVTHMCGAPIVLTMLAHAPAETKFAFDHKVQIATGGAAPPSAVIRKMEDLGFEVLHLYGLTESYGPSTVCSWQSEWNDLDLEGRAAKMARQGVAHVTVEDASVLDPETLEPVPWDGVTMGEIMHRSNTVMKGYLKNPEASEKAFAGGWYHTGDLAVQHPDGYIEVKDRSKDVIISGGENISSLEIEEVLYKNPKVMEAAVVARPDEKWGETPCAFVTLAEGAQADAEEIIAYCRENMAHYKAPKSIVFCALPKTSTGKIQKFVLRERAKEL